MPRGSIADVIDAQSVAALRRFRTEVEAAFPGRLRDAVLFGSQARGDAHEDSDWDVALFIDGFDQNKESFDLGILAARFHFHGPRVSPIGMPSDRRGVSPELLWNIDLTMTASSALQGRVRSLADGVHRHQRFAC
jgi:predicted nucleotidyltransferase